MAEETIKTLDLNDLLGETKAIKVRKDGCEYELTHLNNLGVHKILQFQGFRRQSTMLQLMDTISEDQAMQIEVLFDKMLHVLCADMPLEKFSYTEKTTILAFYFTETAPKKVMSPRTSPTGAVSSPS